LLTLTYLYEIFICISIYSIKFNRPLSLDSLCVYFSEHAFVFHLHKISDWKETRKSRFDLRVLKPIKNVDNA